VVNLRFGGDAVIVRIRLFEDLADAD